MKTNTTYFVAFWSPFPIDSGKCYIDYFSMELHKFANIQCVDCKNNRDPNTWRILRQASLVVIPVRQSHSDFWHIFGKEALRFKNCVFLMVDYFPNPDVTLEHFLSPYRISRDRLVCIPYNPNCKTTLTLGSSDKEKGFRFSPEICHSGMDFKGELKHAARMMLRAMGF